MLIARSLLRVCIDAAFRLALERRAARGIGELATLRRRVGLDDAVPDGLPEPYSLQLSGDYVGAAAAWKALSRPYDSALALADADEEEPMRQAFDELQQLGARPAAAWRRRNIERSSSCFRPLLSWPLLEKD